jgi:hypothetical protein
MKKIALASLILISSLFASFCRANDWQSAHPEWKACKGNNDCVIADGSAFGVTAVNRQYREEFELLATKETNEKKLPFNEQIHKLQQERIQNRSLAGCVCKSGNCILIAEYHCARDSDCIAIEHPVCKGRWAAVEKEKTTFLIQKLATDGSACTGVAEERPPVFCEITQCLPNAGCRPPHCEIQRK